MLRRLIQSNVSKNVKISSYVGGGGRKIHSKGVLKANGDAVCLSRSRSIQTKTIHLNDSVTTAVDGYILFDLRDCTGEKLFF